MHVSVDIPDDLAALMGGVQDDLSRRALEALIADEYRNGRLTKPDLRRALGFTTSDEIDTFLKAHGVWIEYDLSDLERERATMRQLGL